MIDVAYCIFLHATRFYILKDFNVNAFIYVYTYNSSLIPYFYLGRQVADAFKTKYPESNAYSEVSVK